jgi:hypothetical protein
MLEHEGPLPHPPQDKCGNDGTPSDHAKLDLSNVQ